MDKGALIGGVSIVAAVGGLIAFYAVISSPTPEVAEHTRERVAVEPVQKGGRNTPVFVGTTDGADAAAQEASEAPRAADLRPHPRDPDAAKKWEQRRFEARNRERVQIMAAVEDTFKETPIPQESQVLLMKQITQALDNRDNIRSEIEAGTVTPRVGRKRIAEDRERLRGVFAEHVDEDSMRGLQERLAKARLALF